CGADAVAVRIVRDGDREEHLASFERLDRGPNTGRCAGAPRELGGHRRPIVPTTRVATTADIWTVGTTRLAHDHSCLVRCTQGAVGLAPNGRFPRLTPWYPRAFPPQSPSLAGTCPRTGRFPEKQRPPGPATTPWRAEGHPLDTPQRATA